MKNLKKLSREDRKVIIAGIDFPSYCIEGGGPGEGGCSPVLFVQKVNVFLMAEIPAVVEILEAVEEIHIPVSVRGNFYAIYTVPEFYCITG
ncbi:hypothetical protein EJ377_09940 [Chryseobacterium arthrosphaerae]|uniref:Uncharacterized protein n=1 Tax=Chryseobacterium arthrosphaerae TaxID=651561 RepID=A0A3S0Q8E0_9FLAO|nr:hypothetical protein EJ377_09940 [Chryseobacterium arthrosphaerae]